MKLFSLDCRRQVNVNPFKYLIKWEGGREVSKPQAAIKAFLRPYWQHDVVCEELRIPKSLLRIDLINLSKGVVIEVSPGQHHSYNPFFHGSLAGYRASIKRDLSKQAWATGSGYVYLEITPQDPVTVAWFATQGVIL